MRLLANWEQRQATNVLKRVQTWLPFAIGGADRGGSEGPQLSVIPVTGLACFCCVSKQVDAQLGEVAQISKTPVEGCLLALVAL